MKRALITGIGGQIGSHLADFLLDKGYDVHGVVRHTSAPNLERISHLRELVPLYTADLCDQSSLNAIMRKVQPDEVYNLAAQSFVPVSWSQPVLTGDSTALGVARMLEAVRTECPTARFYQASSSEMFGKVRETPQTELTPFYPRSPYGVAKVFGHQICVNYRESYGLYAVSGICFNCEGPRRGMEFVTRKISRGAVACARNKDSKLTLGNLEARRDWGYVLDYVDAIWRTLQQDIPEDYVIATGMQHSVREFCEVAFETVGLDWKDHVVTDPAFIRPAEVDLLVGDPRKILNQCGWRAKTEFKDLVRLMVLADFRHDR